MDRLGTVLLLFCCASLVHAGMFGKDSVDLTPANFKQLVLDSTDPWIVGFYAPWCGHCKNLAPQWDKAATAAKGIVKFGQVDAQEHQSLAGQFGVQGFPTIKVFGLNKEKPTDYQGGRDAQSLTRGALQAAQSVIDARLGLGGSGGGGSSNVIELSEESFQKDVLASDDLWIVAFTAPWCGHCKRLLPEWERASAELKGKAKLGNVDATVHGGLAQRYGVQGYPTIKVFPAGAKTGEAEDYEGGRTASDIVAYMEEKALENMPPPEVVQLTSDETMSTECTPKQICFIAFLPLLQDSGKDGRNTFLDVLRASAEKYKRRPFGWVWSEGTVQGDLETSLDVGGFGYPALVALNAKKEKFATMRGQFSEKGVQEFVNKLVAGRQRTSSIKALPAVADTNAWDGDDFVQDQYEEEFDLSELDDIDLDDDTQGSKEEL